MNDAIIELLKDIRGELADLRHGQERASLSFASNLKEVRGELADLRHGQEHASLSFASDLKDVNERLGALSSQLEDLTERRLPRLEDRLSYLEHIQTREGRAHMVRYPKTLSGSALLESDADLIDAPPYL